jgi:hypothetical protein
LLSRAIRSGVEYKRVTLGTAAVALTPALGPIASLGATAFFTGAKGLFDYRMKKTEPLTLFFQKALKTNT